MTLVNSYAILRFTFCIICHLFQKDIREFPRTILTKVNLARAICGNPAIVILDEPFSGLFPQEVELIRKRIEDFREGKTTIILTDNVSNLYLTDLIYILEVIMEEFCDTVLCVCC